MAARRRHHDFTADNPSTTGNTSDDGCLQAFGPDTKLGVIARMWLDQRRYKQSRTYAQYESRVENHIIDPLGTTAISKITLAIAAAWIDRLCATGLGEMTIGLILAHLSGIFEYAVEDDIISRNPSPAAPDPYVRSSPSAGK
jgi:Phage integrase, N-terminal SAM-like domain